MPAELPRIVVVEDDASMRQALRRILSSAGYAPVTFASAEAALAANAPVLAECLVLDIMLPGMSGLELYRYLLAAGELVPAVFITARDDQAVRKKVTECGAVEYLTKPFAGKALIDAVTVALGTH